MITFGPQLIGQTEKALSALLGRVLTGHNLTEPEWVALRLTDQFDTTENPPAESLAEFIANSAHFPDPRALLTGLTDRGLLAGDHLTERGSATISTLAEQITGLTAPLWTSLDPDDTAAAERTLNIVLARAQAILSTPT